MKKNRIPVFIEPQKTSNHCVSEGVIAASFLKRLSQEVVRSNDVDVSLSIGVDKIEKLPYIKGEFSTKIELICQRCLQPFEKEIKSRFFYVPVQENSDFSSIPEEYDTVMMDEYNQVNLHLLIEDEIIISIPTIPSHNDSMCFLGERDLSAGKIHEAEEQQENPFAALKHLKSN